MDIRESGCATKPWHAFLIAVALLAAGGADAEARSRASASARIVAGKVVVTGHGAPRALLRWEGRRTGVFTNVRGGFRLTTALRPGDCVGRLDIGRQTLAVRVAGCRVHVAKSAARVGPQGPQGLPGAIGPEGPAGPEGPIGPQGVQGVPGEIGPQGAEGPVGPRGETGPQGLKGDPGPVGPAGPVGAQGPEGAQGPIGPAGAQGPQGQQGPQGPVGSRGEVGPVGPAGERGPAGPDGPQGPKGDLGPAGPQGPQGSQGSQGPKGDVGPAGAKGDPGPQGIPGALTPMRVMIEGDFIRLTRAPAKDGGTADYACAPARSTLKEVEGFVARTVWTLKPGASCEVPQGACAKDGDCQDLVLDLGCYVRQDIVDLIAAAKPQMSADDQTRLMCSGKID